MCKKIFIICGHMGMGGVARSLITLLNCLDYERYQVDLFMIRNAGLYYSMIPSEVNILPQGRITPVKLLKEKNLKKIIRSGIAFYRIKRAKNPEEYCRGYWEQMRYVYSKFDKEYDVAISYDEGFYLYYIIDLVKAKRKSTRPHTIYTADFCYKPNFDRIYYNQVDRIVTVAEACANTTKTVFPEVRSKVLVIENIIDKEMIRSLAQQEGPFVSVGGITKIISVGRLSEGKGLDLAAAAMSILKRNGYKFIWYLLGEGEYEKDLRNTVHGLGIDNQTIFLHNQANPYPYIKHADIYIHTSRVEAKSIAVEEAKALCKPIVITNFQTVYDQIEDGKTGLVAEMNPESIADKLRVLIDDPGQADFLKMNLLNYYKSNKDEMLLKIEKLIDGEI